jgi:hypothetical protein
MSESNNTIGSLSLRRLNYEKDVDRLIEALDRKVKILCEVWDKEDAKQLAIIECYFFSHNNVVMFIDISNRAWFNARPVEIGEIIGMILPSPFDGS